MISQSWTLRFATVVVLACLTCFSAAVPALAQAPAKDVDRTTGQYMYTRFCIACHGPEGKGTVIGGPIVARPTGPLTPEQLIKTVRAPLGMMPAFPSRLLSDAQLERIAAHVALLESRASGSAPTPPPMGSAAAGAAKGPALSPVPQVPPADPATYEMKEYPSSCGAGHSISVAPDGRIWFPGIQRHNLVVFDPKTELFVDYLMPYTPQKFMYPHTLVFDRDKNPVFSFEYGDAVGRIVRATGRLEVWPVPTARSRPYGIEVAHDGTIWAVEFSGNNIVQVDPKTGTVREHPHPRIAEDPGLRRMALDSRGNIWFGEHEWGSIGMYDPRTDAWKSWRVPDNGGLPIHIYSFNVDKNDVIWFSHFGGNYIGRFDPRTEKFSVYPHLSKQPVNCRLMDLAPDGTVWCMGSATPNLVRLKAKS